MSKFDYLALSERTASGHYHGDLVSLEEVRRAFVAFFEAAEAIDRIKKLLFYGENEKKGLLKSEFDGKTAHTVISRLAPDNREGEQETSEYILHAVLGVASEAGEMVDALHKAIFRGEPLDIVNLGEESGDVKWYLAMLARVRCVPWDADERRNIEKLTARFPDKFTTENANVRDLDEERRILERVEEVPSIYSVACQLQDIIRSPLSSDNDKIECAKLLNEAGFMLGKDTPKPYRDTDLSKLSSSELAERVYEMSKGDETTHSLTDERAGTQFEGGLDRIRQAD